MRRCSIIILVLSIVVVPVGADERFEFPGTRMGEIAKLYFEGTASNDLEALRDFYADYYAAASLAGRPPEERAKAALARNEQIGALVPALVTAESESSLTITAHAPKMNMWVTATLVFESEEPFKLASVMIRPTAPPKVAGDAREWTTLEELIEQIAAESDVPAIAVATFENDRISGAAVAGVRALGSNDAVQIGDRFHIGSITKSMTATLIGRLVEKGGLSWDTKVPEVLGGFDIREEYRKVTLRQLLHHRAGLPGYLTFDDEEDARLRAMPGSPTEQRAAFVAEVLTSDPTGAPGEQFSYSNAGYVVAALMAEQVAGRPWEVLVKGEVMDPLAMEQSGFGWPATKNRPHEPRGHVRDESGIRARETDAEALGAFLAPAGDVHASIEDLARFALAHLQGLAGRDGLLKAETIGWLHEASLDDPATMHYAAGWIVEERDGVGAVHWHAGSAGSFYATVELYPSQNRGIVVMTNAGYGVEAAETVIAEINQRRE